MVDQHLIYHINLGVGSWLLPEVGLYHEPCINLGAGSWRLVLKLGDVPLGSEYSMHVWALCENGGDQHSCTNSDEAGDSDSVIGSSLCKLSMKEDGQLDIDLICRGKESNKGYFATVWVKINGVTGLACNPYHLKAQLPAMNDQSQN